MADAQPVADFGDYIAGELGDVVHFVDVVVGELVLEVERSAIVKVLTQLRDDVNCQFKLLMDVCGADYPERENRFDVVYRRGEL